MFCKNCGAELKPGQRFCGKCGSKQDDAAQPTQQAPRVQPQAPRVQPQAPRVPNQPTGMPNQAPRVQPRFLRRRIDLGGVRSFQSDCDPVYRDGGAFRVADSSVVYANDRYYLLF